MKLQVLASRYRVRRQTVKAWLIEAGVQPLGRGYGPVHAALHQVPSVIQLHEWYVEQRLDPVEIAELRGVVKPTVYKWLRDAGISLRTLDGERRPSREDLYSWYVTQRLTGPDIAAKTGVSFFTVYRWLREEGITVRAAAPKSPDRPDADTLYLLYQVRGLTLKEVGKLLGTADTRVREWLTALEIAVRQPGGQPGAGAVLRPTPDHLRRWYVEELWSTGEIADYWGVGPTAIGRWLHEAGIPLRSPGNSLESRGLSAPSVDELQRMVWEEHLSYDEIAETLGCDPTAIGYWLHKYDIQRPAIWETRRNGIVPDLPSAEEFANRYAAGESLRAIADDYEVSWQTIRMLAMEYGYQLRPSGWRFGGPIDCADGHVVRSSYEQRVDNWLSTHGIPHENEPSTPFPSRWRADFKVGDTYIEVWGVQGKPSYTRRKEAKLEAYRLHHVKLIELPHWIFQPQKRHELEQRLLPLIEQGRKPSTYVRQQTLF